MTFLPRPRKDAEEHQFVCNPQGLICAFTPQGRRNRGRLAATKSTPVVILGGGCRKTFMLTVRLPADIEKRLDLLAKRTGRTRNFYVRQAILRHIDDLEDYFLARRRLSRKAARVTLEELEREVATAR
jgi:RHH-type rel operon transcriptional repressor/antitoxin RelB